MLHVQQIASASFALLSYVLTDTETGESMIIDPLGKILLQAGGEVEQIVSADIDREAVVRARRRFVLARDRSPDAYGAITKATEEVHG